MYIRNKLDTDFQEDGGWVEASYDGGNTWANVFIDTIHPTISYVPPSGIYPDTLANGQVAFTGFQNSWYPFEISWDNAGNAFDPSLDSMLVRFVFYSDGNPSNKEGWTLDDIRVLRTVIVDGTQENHRTPEFDIFPNPAIDKLFIRTENTDNGTIIIYNGYGEIVGEYQSKSFSKPVSIDHLADGIYYVRLIRENEPYQTRKFIKMKN